MNVKDFALVQSLDIQFDAGLTVITGESGAGKSIILGALGLVLGERAATDNIRPGASRAEVSAEFDLQDNTSARTYLLEKSLEDPDAPGRCLVRRTLTSDGRSRAFLNGTPVNLQVLRGLTGNLIDVHGQHEHQRLAAPEVQLALLDDYGVDTSILDACRSAFSLWKSAAAELDALQAHVRNSEDRASLLQYQLEELRDAAPQVGEFEMVSRDFKRQSQALDLKALVNDALDELINGTTVGSALKQLERVDDDHPDLTAARETLTAALALLDDAGRDLRAYDATLAHDPQAIDSLEYRLTTLHELARKHQLEPEDLPDLVQRLEAQLDSLTTDRSALDALRDSMVQHEKAFRDHASQASAQRRAAADGFAGAVSACMRTLGIDGGALSLEFHAAESASGLETVEFFCTTNPKYPAAPLARVASGGERARISLAIQVVGAEHSALPSLVLDEADVGVGGTTADVVGRLLRSLGVHTQVICVTHAPQVAALGQHHLRVHKDPEQDTRIDPLAEDGRIDELARMLAGSGITDESRDYARTLLDDASDNPIH